MRRLGYAQDRNLDIDRRYGDVEKLKLLAQTVEVFCIWQPAPPRSNSQQSCGTYGPVCGKQATLLGDVDKSQDGREPANRLEC